MRDLHLRIVDHHHIVVDGHPRRANDDEITDNLTGKLYCAMNEIMKFDRVLRNLQADGRGLSVRHPALRFIGIQTSALARVDLWFVLGNGLLPLALQFFGAAETIIGFPLLDQP